MAKYTDEVKMKVISSYLNGKGGYKSLATQFGIAHPSVVQRWVRTYKKLGMNAIRRKKQHTKYPVQLKLDVVNYSLITGESAQEVANHFRIHNPRMIARWIADYQHKGIEAFSNKKGQNQLNKNMSKKELTREQELERENELLRAELAFVKKLQALGIPIPKTLRSDMLGSSKNSGENSN